MARGMLFVPCMTLRKLLAVVLASGLGCVADGGVDEVDLREEGARVSGTFGDLEFSSEPVGADTYEVQVRVDGLTLLGLLDTATGVAELDGFATGNGGDTQLRDTDREALAGLLAELDRLGDLQGAKLYLRRAVSLWSAIPPSKELTLEIVAERDRSYSSLCGYMYTYARHTHDCWDYDRWDYRSTAYGYLSMEGPVGSDNNAWYYDGYWHYSEPNHRANVYIRYNCFGRCGIGCGGDRQFTRDCADHDGCVTMGHDKLSFWCDDEWTSATDDWTFAPSC